MASVKRELIRGKLKEPQIDPMAPSQTQVPNSKNEISVRRSKDKEIPGEIHRSYIFRQAVFSHRMAVVEFSSRAVPQPFLDPSIMQRRILAEKQWKVEQEKKLKQGEASFSSR
jgi:hypothetical protein